MRLQIPNVHLVGRRLTPELVAVARELRCRALIYAFETTADLVAAWRLARGNDAAECLQATAVVWLQSRGGEFSPAEVDAVQILDPLARPIVVAGCWSEGEPRSGRPLAGATRLYWHQGAAAILALLADELQPLAPHWIAIHAARQLDYQGIAGLCQSLGLRTIWQPPEWPVVSSEPALRLFLDWSSWEAWLQQQPADHRTPAILLQGFPRPIDQQRAAAEGIDAVVALPAKSADLQRAIALLLQTRNAIRQIHREPAPTAIPRRRSA